MEGGENGLQGARGEERRVEISGILPQLVLHIFFMRDVGVLFKWDEKF